MSTASINRKTIAVARQAVRPGLRYGTQPVARRGSVKSSFPDRVALRIMGLKNRVMKPDANEWLSLIRLRISELEKISEVELNTFYSQFTDSLLVSKHSKESISEAIAFVSVNAVKTLKLQPHDVQLIAVNELLEGRFVEFATGEGKTLCMAMAVAVAAMDGTPIHVLTASDHLAQRDAEWLLPFYKALGISVSFVLPAMSDDERRTAYHADIVYVTGKQVAFDWLRDCIDRGEASPSLTNQLGELCYVEREFVRRKPLLRGLCSAFVDEADSLLIDEARTPLILAAPVANDSLDQKQFVVALTFARLLHEGVEFHILPGNRIVNLTIEGEEALDTLSAQVEGLWRSSRYRNERVREALSVLHCWNKDRDYVVRNNQIELIDRHTGRALPDRRLQHGLHRLLELKERCNTTEMTEVLASMPFQQFFRRYIRLCGMSGTLLEVQAEITAVYDTAVVSLKPHVPSNLINMPTRVFSSKDEQLTYLVSKLRWCLERGRAVLVGTCTVEQTNLVSAVLHSHNLPHNVLSASQDAEEAFVVSKAGLSSQITVATNMAGRGTDIKLGPDVARVGGLHVIGLGLNESRRLDRQLAGRAARQGDPGSFERLLSLEDTLLQNESPHFVLKTLNYLLRYRYHGHKAGMAIATTMASLWILWIQKNIERKHAVQRQLALKVTEQLKHHTAIGSHNEPTS